MAVVNTPSTTMPASAIRSVTRGRTFIAAEPGAGAVGRHCGAILTVEIA